MMGLFEKKIGGIIKKHINKVRSKLKMLTNPKKIANKLFKGAFAKIQGLLGKPKALEDYVKAGNTYIAKRVLVIGALVVLIILFVGNRYIMPWAEGRLWIPKIVVNTNKFFTYSGKAKVVTADKELLYIGEMHEGRIVGTGTLFHPEGHIVYRGEFLNEMYHGFGERFALDGSLIYRGQFANNLYHGEGQLFHPNGNLKLSGNFIQGRFNGEGKLYDELGRLIYHGMFLDDLFDGTGISFNSSTNRIIYEGQFRQGLYHGLGRLYDPELGRLIYDGMFNKGVFSGQGTLYNWKGQEIFTGYLFNGEIDYFRFIDAPVDMVRADFGSEDQVLFYQHHFLMKYREFNIFFSLGYPELGLPIVDRIIFLGEQKFLGGYRGMSIGELTSIFGESYSQFDFLVDEERQEILRRLGVTSQPYQLYSIRYLLNDEVFVRFYALDPEGEVLYFEMGGL